MFAPSKMSSASSDSTSGLISRLMKRSARPNEGSNQDNPVFGMMPTASASVPGSSARPTDCVRVEIPSLRDESITPPPMFQTSPGEVPKRVKISTKGTSVPVKTKRKAKVINPVHTFTSSKSKFAGGLDKIQTLSGASEPLELLVPELNQMPWDCPPGYISLYEHMFTKGGLWFPLPRLLIAYVEERMIALSQRTTPCIRNLVAVTRSRVSTRTIRSWGRGRSVGSKGSGLLRTLRSSSPAGGRSFSSSRSTRRMS
ncbi:unnamed protein product [Cochlearia groenlandica]